MKLKSVSVLISGLIAAAFTINSDACTTILVGAGATSDGSRIIARTEDHDPTLSKVMLKHHAKENSSDTFHANENKFTYSVPKKAFSYTSFSNGKEGKQPDQMTWGAAGFNQKGVGMTATETIFASAEALKHDPYLPETGITEDSITDVILPYVSSAREGAARLGKIIEEKGAGEGFGVAFVDQHDIWYLETGSGHQWLATRLPKDDYYVTGNQGRLQTYKPDDSANYMASPTLISAAEKYGLYDPKRDGDFNFEKAYTLHNEKNDPYYNYPRVYALQHLYTPDIKTSLAEPQHFPVFAKPEAKLDIDAVKQGLRNTYENIERKPYTQTPDYRLRPVSLFRTQQAHILQARDGLPQGIADVEYLAYGMPSISIFIPVYANSIHQFPQAYRTVTSGKADSVSAQWQFRKLQTLVMMDYYKYAPVVQKAYKQQEATFSVMQRDMEKAYLATYQKDPAKAQQLVQQFEDRVFSDALSTTQTLTNQIFTQLTQDVNTKYKFAGA
ncbi:C69 family dipeptidase [Edwardsiella piscicida]|uniref:C69 family dipeptidase n=1 Tax=Edwardsiella piscicida TaxID=1263550 RepID=UPI00370DD8A4